MGRWCEVKCDCLDREPVPGSELLDFRVFRKRFGGRIRSEAEWREDVQGMYKCGHRDGVLFQSWPGDLHKIGWALEAVYREQPDEFKIFRRVSDCRNYEDEDISLNIDQVCLWQLEIEQIRRYVVDEDYMGWDEKALFIKALAETPFLHGSIPETLHDGLRFCNASVKTGNPIEFFW